jgi:CheY-like chemotaxis protein
MLDAAARLTPDVIVIDISMLGMSGLEALGTGRLADLRTVDDLHSP